MFLFGALGPKMRAAGSPSSQAEGTKVPKILEEGQGGGPQEVHVQAVGGPQPPAWLEKAPVGPLEDSAGGVAWQHSLVSSLQLILKQRRHAR